LPKLLDVIKEKGLTHQEVIKLIEGIGLPETQEEEKDVPEEEIQEDDKPEEPIELYISDNTTEIVEELQPIEEEITLTPEELDKKIADAVEKKLKAVRKVPSKGKIVGKPRVTTNVVKRNWFEEIV